MKVHTKFIKAFGALLIAALLFAALPAGEVKAATLPITVCPGGSCDYTTIQAAVDAASDGATIEVGPGTYIEGIGGAEALVLNVPNLTLKSTNGRDETIIDANGATTGVWVLANLGTVTFDGFTVQNFAQNGVVQSYTQRIGTAFRIWNSLVDSSNGYLRNGLQVAGDYSEVKNNIVYGAPMDDTWASTAIGVINASNVVVSGNTIQQDNDGISNPDIGINVMNYSALASDITVENNTVNDAGNGIRISASDSTYIVQNVTIQNNILEENNKGINVQTVDLHNSAIANNTIRSSHDEVNGEETEFGTGIRFSDESATATNVAITGNTFSDNETYQVFGHAGATIDVASVLAANTFDKAVVIEGEPVIYSSIQAAIDAASDGATINVYPGTYAEALELRTPNITVQSTAGAATTILDVPFGTLTTGVKVLANMGTVTFDGFTVKNFTEGGIIQGMAAREGTTFHVLNNVVLPYIPTDSTPPYLRNGIQVSGDGSTVKGNFVQGAYLTPDWGSTGILVVNASNVVVENNEVSGDLIGLDMGIGVLNYSVTSMDNIQILNNVIHGVDYSLDVSAANGTISGVVINGNQVTDYIEPLWAGIYGSGISVATVDATHNWWGSPYGPQGPVTGDVTVIQWCADAACTTFLPVENTEGKYVVELSGDINVLGGIQLNVPGVTYLLKQGTTIQNNSPCFVVNANDVQIIGEFPGEQTCVPTGDSAGIEVADGVQGLQVVNLKFDGSQTTHTTAIDFAGGVDGFQILNNYFDGFATAIAFGGTVTNAYDDYFIQGNMFDGATIVPGTNSINAEYNSWGVNADPGITNVDADPFTHADLWADTDYAFFSGNQIEAGETITYTVYANLTEISGAEFTLTYPTTLLALDTTSNLTTLFEGIPVAQDLLDTTTTPGVITFRGIVPLGTDPVTGTDVELFTVTFDVVGTVPTLNSGMVELVEVSQGFSMTPADPQFTNHVFPFALTDADLTVIDLPTITADGIEGYYLVDETREFTVTLTNPLTGGDFAHVLFRFEVTADAGDVTLFNYWDAVTSTWLPMPLTCDAGTCVGYFGPSAGFPIDDGFTATSNFQVEFAADGLYPFTITLVDLDAASKVLDTYTNTAVVYTVPMITSTDITGPYQATDPQAFNLTVTVDPDMVGAVVFELEFDFPDGTVISYGGMDYTCTATGCPLFPVTLVGGANTLPFTVTFPAGYIGDVTVSLFDTGWDPDRLLASKTFDLIVYGNFAVDGKVMMQGRYSRGGVLMTLTGLEVLGYGPYPTTSLDKLGQNLFFTDVAEGYYVVTTGQDRYLNVPGAMLVVNNTMTLPDLYLYGGNANNDDAIGIGDASVVGGAYGIGDILSDGDVNFDNRVNIQDLALVGGNYNLTDAIYDDWIIPYDVQGQVTADEFGHVTGSLTGTYNITIDGQVTDYVNNQATFTGTVSGAISGTVTATINENGTGTMFGTLIEDVTLEEFQIMGIFPKSGVNGHFVGTIVQGYAPSVTGIEITAPATTVVEGGTLQMSAVVTPSGAYDRVIWSVWTTETGGRASIDPITGLLTGVSEGPVIVIVKALDGSLLDDTFAVTVTAP